MGAATVGVEGGRMRMFEYDALRRHMGNGEVRNADAALQALRIAKDEDEIASLSRAIQISELALGETLEEVGAGDTEQAIAALLKTLMLAHGSAAFGFDPIVLAGANAANPHGTPGDTPLEPGDALLIDFGAKIDGFSADITRTFFCEHVNDRHAEIYETVRAANALGRRVAGPGVTAHDLDTAVTDVLRSSPFADMIVHKTGHGLGLDVHEAPQVMVGNHQDAGTRLRHNRRARPLRGGRCRHPDRGRRDHHRGWLPLADVLSTRASPDRLARNSCQGHGRARRSRPATFSPLT